ncbi:MAG: TMEM175 family protein [Candidatus Dormibacterales bacterium]
MSKARAEAFSDGVFAVAATLLVFSLVVPDVKSGLGTALLNDWPSYATYAISFGTILVIWVNHHAVLDAMTHFDRTLLFLNGLLLMTVAAIPFPTGVLARYLQAGHDQKAAAAAYGIAMSLMALAFTLMNLYARKRGVINVPFNILGFSFGQLMYPLGAVAALVSAELALLIYGGTMVFYIVLPLVREAQARRAQAP